MSPSFYRVTLAKEIYRDSLRVAFKQLSDKKKYLASAKKQYQESLKLVDQIQHHLAGEAKYLGELQKKLENYTTLEEQMELYKQKDDLEQSIKQMTAHLESYIKRIDQLTHGIRTVEKEIDETERRLNREQENSSALRASGD